MTEAITAAKETLGCGSAIASSSALTGPIIGKTVDEVFPITNQGVADSLGSGLPPKKTHCGVMGHEALQPAIANHHGRQWRGDHEQRALACECFGVDQWMIERAVVSTRLPPSSRSLATQRLMAAASHASKQSRKCLCECGGRRRLHHGSGGLYGRHNRCPRPEEQGKVESRFRNRHSLAAGCGERRRLKQFKSWRDPKPLAAKLRRCDGRSPPSGGAPTRHTPQRLCKFDQSKTLSRAWVLTCGLTAATASATATATATATANWSTWRTTKSTSNFRAPAPVSSSRPSPLTACAKG